MNNDTNISRSDDEILRTPLVSSTNDILTDPSLVLFRESQFPTSKSTTPIIY